MAGKGGLLRMLSPEQAALLGSEATIQLFGVGERLFEAGDPAADVVVLDWGLAKMVRRGPEEEIVDVCGPGDLVGELTPSAEGTHAYAAVALGDSVAMRIPAPAFNRFLEQYPDIAAHLLRTAVGWLRAAERHRRQLASNAPAVRVRTRLTELAARFGEPRPDGVWVELALSTEDLSAWSTATPDEVDTVLTGLELAGIVEPSARGFLVLDLTRLRAGCLAAARR
ncbi:MAG TPA: Crp/Fnr family transcriptional regulator [Acidimicrobiales bacterium]|nr:Crp/Fnr family transcriptional regulator [Acidimicrobiales bacterium]